jgi:hypothetical protein
MVNDKIMTDKESTMKTKALLTGLLLITGIFNLQVSFAKPELNDIDRSSFLPDAIEFNEEELNLEKWMTELYAFSFSSSVSTESDMEIESWMTRVFPELIELPVSSEQEIVIEEWMTKMFEIDDQADYSVSEQVIEPWMTQIISFNK